MLYRKFTLFCAIALGYFSTLSALTQDQISFFWKNGYLVIEDFLSEEEMHSLLNETDHLIDQCNLDQSLTPFHPNGSYVRSKYFIESADKIAYFFETAALDSDGKLRAPLHQSLNKIGHNLHDLNPVFEKITYQEKFKQIPKDLGWVSPSLCNRWLFLNSPTLEELFHVTKI